MRTSYLAALDFRCALHFLWRKLIARHGISRRGHGRRLLHCSASHRTIAKFTRTFFVGSVWVYVIFFPLPFSAVFSRSIGIFFSSSRLFVLVTFHPKKSAIRYFDGVNGIHADVLHNSRWRAREHGHWQPRVRQVLVIIEIHFSLVQFDHLHNSLNPALGLCVDFAVVAHDVHSI